LALSGNILAQKFQRSINWPVSEGISKKLEDEQNGKVLIRSNLWFDGNVDYPNQSTMLPYYSELIPVSNSIDNLTQIQISITSKKFLALNSNEIDILKSISNKSIDEQQNIFYVSKSRGQSFLQLSIPAVATNPSNQRPEKLVSFTIEISENVSSSKSMALSKTATESVLASGIWKMVRVSKTGVHKMSFAELQSMGLTNLDNVSVWGQGGKQLPFWNNQESLDDLKQIPLWMEKGSDGVFNSGDNIYFFAQGPVVWSYNSTDNFFVHTIHDYTQQINYFITTSKANPLRISSQTEPTLPATRISTSFDALVFFEKNDTNLIKSGRQWFGESYDVYSTKNYNTGLMLPVTNGRAKVRVSAAARSSESSSYSIKANGTLLGSIVIPSVSTSNQYSNFAAVNTRTFDFAYFQDELKFELTFSKPSPAANGWLDYITVNARQQLVMGTSQLLFRDVESIGADQITEFTLTSAVTGVIFWDVTNFFNPQVIQHTILGSTAKFKVQTTSLKEFIAFTPSQALSVSIVGNVANQNIHGQPQPEMVIVAHPNFLQHAQELAQIHLDNSGLKSLVVTNQQVYNEFSSGNPDVSAIRNMMRMFYKRSTSETDMPKYLLLFGDGSYDNRTSSSVNSNYVLTYQSENSLHVTNSFVSDDFFGLLDDLEGEATGLLDIGIGRIPCTTEAEANTAVSKIRQYLSPSSFGGWNNQLCFIGDDGDGNMHMRDANLLAQYVEDNHPQYNIDKIYFDAYPLVSTSLGNRYPDVTDAINNRANQGTLIVNYVGHANTRWLAHERVLMINDIQGWRNFSKLSLFITATCEFSRFDDYFYKSAGEHTLFSPHGGSVALVSTSRVVYANPNYTLNRNFIRYVFAERPGFAFSGGERFYRLGDVLRLAKIETTGQVNKRNFMLLGDPALKLHYPQVDMAVTHINGKTTADGLDTLKALSRVQIDGIIQGSKLLEDFVGQTEITLYDKAKEITTLSNTGNLPFKFTTRPSSIYKGVSTIKNGTFSSTFIIPKDISYSYGQGRFSLFAKNSQFTGSGFFENFVVGGISENGGNDTQGPEIKIFMNSKNFVSGGITNQSPKLIVQLEDSSGINTTGVGIGHDLTAKIIGSMSQRTEQNETVESMYVLNDYYVAAADNFQKGTAEYQLSNLSAGNYSVKVKAWDVFNNSTETEIDFKVLSDEDFSLSHILNYPNPFTESTGFYFEHNQPFEEVDVLIHIFSPSGKLVKTLDHFEMGTGNVRVGPIIWDGLDDFGDRVGRGVYFYRLKVRLGNGQSAQVFQKLVILK
jgi:hypothetical protein